MLEQHTKKPHIIYIQPALKFISKATSQLQDQDNIALQATKQLSLHAATQGYDKELMKEAMAWLMENIISRKNLRRRLKKRQPSRLRKRLWIRNRGPPPVPVEDQMTNEDNQVATEVNVAGDMDLEHGASPINQTVASLPVVTSSRHSVQLRQKWGQKAAGMGGDNTSCEVQGMP